MNKGKIGVTIGLIAVIISVGVIFAGSNSFSFSSYTPFIYIILFSVFIPLLKKKGNEGESRQETKGTSTNYNSSFSNQIHCHKCKTLIDNSSKYCSECGASQRDTIICQYCGKENSKSNALCEKCNGFL
ncbi:MAG: zinc ribbon domain-containing protein [Tenericutes bacterium]|nr:zinc ribbon domain-containing protein [Mycoplasmatota bacterium]